MNFRRIKQGENQVQVCLSELHWGDLVEWVNPSAVCPHHKKSLLAENPPREPPALQRRKCPSGVKKWQHRHFSWDGLNQKGHFALRTSVWRVIGKKTKKCIFISFLTLDFPHSAKSQDDLLESRVLSYTHGAKTLLTPSQKSLSSVCLWVPASVNHIIAHQRGVCQCLCCTADVLRDFSRGKTGACVLRVAHTYTYSRKSIIPSFSNISAIVFRSPALPKKQGLGLL